MPRRTRLPLIALAVTLLYLAGAGVAAAGAPIYPHQSPGNRGSDVRALQGLLRHHGATNLYISSIFDAPTVAASVPSSRPVGCRSPGWSTPGPGGASSSASNPE